MIGILLAVAIFFWVDRLLGELRPTPPAPTPPTPTPPIESIEPGTLRTPVTVLPCGCEPLASAALRTRASRGEPGKVYRRHKK
jgi:hypothetical protein